MFVVCIFCDIERSSDTRLCHTEIIMLQSTIRQTISGPLHCLNVHCTRTLLPILNLELDCLTFCQGLEAVSVIQ